ncbi:hypothetical protein GBO77_07190 [Pediococcus acidilactici]|uniref:hypothetical protein n=1 Tax=Pediococcus acidilactici TaxID=1254 RepID=UPI0013210B5C|nr:hypothetical protein [Pediococcus acidilactici]KAF0413709.1 hypothetical protein GBO77_07190 [Pediococcus acidilactici]
MKLVKIDSDLYLNSDFIESVEADGEGSTDITMKNGEVFSPNVSIKKVLDAICGSEEHSVEYEDDENYRRNKGLVNDTNMNILKAESINSGHLNQQKYPSR